MRPSTPLSVSCGLVRRSLPKVAGALGGQATIGDLCKGRQNNFDLIRFLAAVAVVFSHAFPLSQGDNNCEPLMILSKGQATTGVVALATFFIVSGFLITQSYDRSRDLLVFVKSRFLRIVPGLVMVVLFTAFVLGPWVSSVPPAEYFRDPETFGYLKTILLHNSSSHLLPGVFESNPFGRAVNGSIWTLEPEIVFYGVVGILGVTGLLRTRVILLVFLAGFSHPWLPLPRWEAMAGLFRFFVVGMALYSFRDHIPLSWPLAVISVLVLMWGLVSGAFTTLFPLFGGYLVMYFALSPGIRLSGFSRIGDFSYGMYVSAFPIQQTVVQLHGGKIDPLDNFVLSLPFVLMYGALSWHFLEKRALRLKTVPLLRSRRGWLQAKVVRMWGRVLWI